jgi:hypothetical protein
LFTCCQSFFLSFFFYFYDYYSYYYNIVSNDTFIFDCFAFDEINCFVVMRFSAEADRASAEAEAAGEEGTWSGWAVEATRSLTSLVWQAGKAGTRLVLASAAASSPRGSPRKPLRASDAGARRGTAALRASPADVSSATGFVVLTSAYRRADALLAAAAAARLVASRHPHSPVQCVLTWHDVRRLLPVDDASDVELRLLLDLLLLERRAVRLALASGARGYVLLDDSAPFVARDDDRSILALKLAEENLLHQQRKALDDAEYVIIFFFVVVVVSCRRAEAIVCRSECGKQAVRVAKSERTLALRHVARRQRLLKAAAQRGAALDNVRAVIEGIDEAHSAAQVHDALHAGASALRAANAKAAPREQLDATLDDIEELLDDQRELLERIADVGGASLPSDDDAELQRELDQLELSVAPPAAAAAAAAAASVGSPIATTAAASTSTSTSVTNSPTADLRARLDALTVNSNSPVKQPASVQSNQQLLAEWTQAIIFSQNSITMTFKSQFIALFKKNILLKKRLRKQTIGELVYPIYIVGILILVKFLTVQIKTYPAVLNSPIVSLTHYEYQTASNNAIDGMLRAGQQSNFTRPVLAFTPNDTDTTQFMFSVLKTLKQQQFNTSLNDYGVRASYLQPIGFSDQSQLLQFYNQQTLTSFFAAIEFSNTSNIDFIHVCISFSNYI